MNQVVDFGLFLNAHALVIHCVIVWLHVHVFCVIELNFLPGVDLHNYGPRPLPLCLICTITYISQLTLLWTCAISLH